VRGAPSRKSVVFHVVTGYQYRRDAWTAKPSMHGRAGAGAARQKNIDEGYSRLAPRVSRQARSSMLFTCGHAAWVHPPRPL
jgi:hypothetical protein